MTIATEAASIVYDGDGVANVWAFDFRIPVGGVEVWLDTGSGVYTLVSPGDYTVFGEGDPLGGTVTYPVGGPLTSGRRICIQRGLPYTQPTAVSNQAFYPHTVEDMDDYATMLIQQLLDAQLGSIRGQPGDRMAILPGASARAGQWLVFDIAGNPVPGIPQFNSVTGNASFFMQGNGLGPGGVAPYNIHAFRFLTATSRFENLPARGWEIISNTSLANDFATYRTLLQQAWNNPTLTTGGSFYNGGRPYGEDGFFSVNTNAIDFNSDNNLTGPYFKVTPTIVGGVITSVVVLPASVAGHTYDPLHPPQINAYDNSGSGSGFAATAVVNGSGILTGAAVITNHGTGYNAATTFLFGEAPPNSEERDNGPQLDLNRFPTYGALGDNTYLGWIYYTGSTATAIAPNATYGSIGTRIISNDDVSPRGEMILSTSNDFDIGANWPRLFISQGAHLGIFVENDDTKDALFDPGEGFFNCTGVFVNNFPFEYQGVPTQFRWQVDQAIESLDPGATYGPVLNLSRRSPSPAVNDQGGQLNWQFLNNAGTPALWSACYIVAQALSVTAGAETGQVIFTTPIAGAYANRMILGQGLAVGAPTGGLLGNGKINAEGVYDDGVLLTCYPVELFRTGKIDVAYWDGKVPNSVVPEVAATLVPKMKKVVREEPRVVENADGTHSQVMEKIEREEHQFEEVPIFNEDGSPKMKVVTRPELGPVRRPNWIMGPDGVVVRDPDMPWKVVQDVVHTRVEQQEMGRKFLFEEAPAQAEVVTERKHEPMRKFMARLGTDMDPTTLEGFVKHMKVKGHLSMMPNPQKYTEENKLSVGEWMQRQLEFADIAGILFSEVLDRLNAAEAKLAALDGGKEES